MTKSTCSRARNHSEVRLKHFSVLVPERCSSGLRSVQFSSIFVLGVDESPTPGTVIGGKYG